jgi:hypothetical protein
LGASRRSNPDHLVFIAETWAATNIMARHYGRTARGLRLLAAVPHGQSEANHTGGRVAL